MRRTKIKEQIDIKVIDGNQLVGQVIDEKDAQVEQCVNTINDLPDSVDIKRVMAIKQKVADGTYDFDANLSQVVDAIIDESTDENPLAFPVFDR